MPPMLPPGLIDLISARLCAAADARASASWKLNFRRASTIAVRRYASALIAYPAPVPAPVKGHTEPVKTNRLALESTGGLTVRRPEKSARRLDKLQEDVAALGKIVVTEQPDNIEFSDNQLAIFYEDLLALPSTSSKEQSTSPSDSAEISDLDLVQALDARMSSSSSAAADLHITSLASPLSSHRANAESTEIQSSSFIPGDILDATVPAYRQVLDRLQVSLARIAKMRELFPEVQQSIPIVLVSSAEWDALVRLSVASGDLTAAEQSLRLQRLSDSPISEASCNVVLEHYAANGKVEDAERILSTFLSGDPTPRQRHLHIKAYIKSTPSHSTPIEALNLLHAYESKGLPAPISGYTRVIWALICVKSSLAFAQGWDLFAHMRYAAHPTPDVQLYTLMIRACSFNPKGAEPERALDLWTEMTVDHQLAPNEPAYAAIILACARSGRKSYVAEAFRLAKQMLDTHRDARGRAAFHPDSRVVSALLEGAKRIRDLARARWILAELAHGTGRNGVKIDEHIMTHVFHAYAAYIPPLKRSAIPFAEDSDNTQSLSGDANTIETPLEKVLSTEVESLSHVPPQTHEDTLDEARHIFERILQDIGAGEGPFANVRKTNQLVDSYLTVHYAHGSLANASVLYETLYGRLGLKPGAWSYVQALEFCAESHNLRGERAEALNWAEDLWTHWSRMEREGLGLRGHRTTARLIERAHAAMIRVLTLSNRVPQALRLLQSFVNKYPPSEVRTTHNKSMLRSSRTALVGQRPIIRMLPSADIPDDHVPPILTFPELELLHHRLVIRNDRQGLAFVKWVVKAYDGSLRMRRDSTVKLEPQEGTQL